MLTARVLLSLLFVVAGVCHFIVPDLYASIIPAWLPAHYALVVVSGVAEIAGGLGLCFRVTRPSAAWGLVLLLLAVFPANIHMALHPHLFPRIPAWALYVRLPLQFVLIAWTWLFTPSRDNRKAPEL